MLSGPLEELFSSVVIVLNISWDGKALKPPCYVGSVTVLRHSEPY